MRLSRLPTDKTGLAQPNVRAPDLILMDVQLPVLDGYEATRQIKADPTLAKTPVIAVSSFAMKGDEEKAGAAGCDHYVTKPYSPLQLLRTIRGVLGEHGQGSTQSALWVRFLRSLLRNPLPRWSR
jgi:two-component system cell cycle response regulator DivK